MKAQEKADKLATKDATKKQPKVSKKNGKKSLIVVLLYKKTSISFTKAVTFAEHVEVVTEEERSKIVITKTR